MVLRTPYCSAFSSFARPPSSSVRRWRFARLGNDFNHVWPGGFGPRHPHHRLTKLPPTRSALSNNEVAAEWLPLNPIFRAVLLGSVVKGKYLN